MGAPWAGGQWRRTASGWGRSRSAHPSARCAGNQGLKTQLEPLVQQLPERVLVPLGEDPNLGAIEGDHALVEAALKLARTAVQNVFHAGFGAFHAGFIEKRR